MKKLLKTLTETLGPSGHENAVRSVVMKEIKPLVDEVRVDALGNVIARVKPSGMVKTSTRIMLAGHMDEASLVASHIDKNGFVRFTTVGETFGRCTLGARVKFLNGITGVVGFENLDRADSFNKMFIDVGATSPKDCPVKVGDIAVFDHPFIEMGRRLVAKSMDNRSGVAVLIETMRSLILHQAQGKPILHDVYFVFTTQEKMDVRGATTATFGIDPDIGLTVDVTPVGDTPGANKVEMRLGAGPCIKIRDALMLADPRVVDWMVKVAEKAHIPFQREVSVIDSTDARAIQLARAGVIVGGLSIPVRYKNSSSEMVDNEDLKNSAKLLTALLAKSISL